MAKVTIRNIIQTSIVTAFIITVALIWKDVIIDIIELFVPPTEELAYKFVVAVIATVIVIIAIYIILETEHETEVVIRKLKKRKNKK